MFGSQEIFKNFVGFAKHVAISSSSRVCLVQWNTPRVELSSWVGALKPISDESKSGHATLLE